MVFGAVAPHAEGVQSIERSDMSAGYVMPYQVPPHAAPARPSLRARARVWLNRSELDAQLADGADPTRSEELRLRAEQLRGPKQRARIANSAGHLLTVARRRRQSGVIRPQGQFGPSEVIANRELLYALAKRVRDPRFDSPQGLAMASIVLRDARAPLSLERPPQTLADALRGTLSALDASRLGAPAGIERRRAPAPSLREAA
jgi:hypothetical protein